MIKLNKISFQIQFGKGVKIGKKLIDAIFFGREELLFYETN
jgi:hypothetical protein